MIVVRGSSLQHRAILRPWVPARVEPVIGPAGGRTRWLGRDDGDICRGILRFGNHRGPCARPGGSHVTAGMHNREDCTCLIAVRVTAAPAPPAPRPIFNPLPPPPAPHPNYFSPR